jgi:hypothetical protein
MIEIGTASGAGLMNLRLDRDARRPGDGITCNLHGFDSGTGMPPAVDYRDHPDLYQQHDFDMNADPRSDL